MTQHIKPAAIDLQISALKHLPSRLSTKICFNSYGGCWLWVGPTNPLGYAMVWDTSTQRVRGLHRLIYELLVKPIPKKLTIDHLCRQRNCANPLHMEVVSHRENCLRGTSPVAQNSRKIYCSRNHLLDGEHLFIDKKNHRRCKTCANYTRRISRKLRREFMLQVIDGR